MKSRVRVNPWYHCTSHLSCDLLWLTRRHAPYPNLYPDQSPSEEWTMEERFRPLTFHGLILRSQLVNLLVRGVCYAENQSVRHARTDPCWRSDFWTHV